MGILATRGRCGAGGAEAERKLYGLGLGYGAGSLHVDLYYNYIDQGDRRGRVRSELPPSTTAEGVDRLNVGVFSSTGHLVGLTLSYIFGARR